MFKLCPDLRKYFFNFVFCYLFKIVSVKGGHEGKHDSCNVLLMLNQILWNVKLALATGILLFALVVAFGKNALVVVLGVGTIVVPNLLINIVIVRTIFVVTSELDVPLMLRRTVIARLRGVDVVLFLPLLFLARKYDLFFF